MLRAEAACRPRHRALAAQQWLKEVLSTEQPAQVAAWAVFLAGSQDDEHPVRRRQHPWALDAQDPAEEADR